MPQLVEKAAKVILDRGVRFENRHENKTTAR